MHRKGIKCNWLKQVRGMKKVTSFKRGMKKTPLALNGSLPSSVSTPTIPQTYLPTMQTTTLPMIRVITTISAA